MPKFAMDAVQIDYDSDDQGELYELDLVDGAYMLIEIVLHAEQRVDVIVDSSQLVGYECELSVGAL